jgi:penicillin-binding protein 1C
VELGVSAGFDAALALKVRNGLPPFVWFANGAPIRHEAFARTSRWVPDGPGFASFSVVDGSGRSSRVSVFLE